jgi:hypothetical protein
VRSDLASAGVSSTRFGESVARLGYRHQLLNLLVERALGDDLIDDAEGSGILGRQEIVAVKRPLDGVVVLAGMADIHFVKPPLHLDDVLGMALDIAGLTLKSARGLMQQDAGVGLWHFADSNADAEHVRS